MVSSKEPQKVVITNCRQQPIELHYGEQVVVLPPDGRLEISAEAAASAQVQALRRRRLISLRPVAVLAAEAESSEPSSDDEQAEASPDQLTGKERGAASAGHPSARAAASRRHARKE